MAATVNLWHTLSFRKVLGFTFQKCFKYSKDNLGRHCAVMGKTVKMTHVMK